MSNVAKKLSVLLMYTNLIVPLFFSALHLFFPLTIETLFLKAWQKNYVGP